MTKCALALLFAVVLCGHLVSAQVTTGTISGVVQDPTGASIPGVAVTIKNVDTGITRAVTTDVRGRYTAPNLSLGNYEVQAEQSGFQTEVRSGITLTVGREAVVNIALKVGNVAETVTVTGEAPLVESTTSTLSSLVDERTVRELPLNGRSYDQLALLQPGVVTMAAGNGQGQNFDYGGGRARFSVGGSRSYANSFLLDGTNINDHANNSPGGAAGNNLGVDGIREFKIVTTTFSAEYGRSSGGVVSAITRSGTNQLHGSAFEFLRNSTMDARNFFDRGSDPPPFRRNQFGGSLGGPVKKNKTFFFGTYEGLRQGLGTSTIGFVPTALAKGGTLPCSAVPAALLLQNPCSASGTVNLGVNSAVKPFLALYPDPNGRDFRDGTGEFLSAPTVVTNENYVMSRVDHQLSDKISIFGRYSFDSDSNVNPTDQKLPIFSLVNTARRQYSTLQVSAIVSPTVLNSFRFAYNRTNQLTDTNPNVPLGPELSFVPGQEMGIIQVGSGQLQGGSRAVERLGQNQDNPRAMVFNLFQWGDDLTWVKGRHTVKTGVNIERIRDNSTESQVQRGVYNFDDLSFLLVGQPSLFEAQGVGLNQYRGHRQTAFYLYAQDDFKMSPRLTLNLGLRWEVLTDPTEANGKVSNLVDPLDPKFTVLDSFFSLGKKDFQPRVGFAWQANGSGTTVMRAGFGIFHDHVFPGTFALDLGKAPPFSLLLNVAKPNFPNGYLQLTQGALPRADLYPPVIKETTKYSYNFSLQQQLVKDTVLEAAYIGSQSRHLAAGAQENTSIPIFVNGQPTYLAGAPRRNPNFAALRRRRYDTNTNYNAFQVTLRRRSPSGVQYQAFYTFAKSVDGRTAIAGGDSRQEANVVLDPGNPGRDRGLSAFNAKHNFVFSAGYPFPFRFQQKAVEMFLGGWTINGIGTLRAGGPFTVFVGSNRSRNGDTMAPDRPDLAPGASADPTHGTTAGCGHLDPTTGKTIIDVVAGQKLGTADRFFDPCAFLLPEEVTFQGRAAGTYGNLGRNTIQGPGLANLDLSLQKNFRVQESVNVQFRAELFNVLNHTNLGLPSTALFSSVAYIGSAGRVTDTNTKPREVQLGLKVIF